MKIWVDNQPEYEMSKEACKLIHDSNVNQNHNMVNLISHLYLSEKDAPGIKGMIHIKDCEHVWYAVFPGFGDESRPTGRRCSKCNKQEFY